ncbi:uncharacterized protein LOC110733383 [Chenopodium quinoa]|uniref:uncharacterized protein LOC110733383 n=1 Tax=Chenopodium quinoa TaxID=63459 RepID=UPI000B772BF7|nr:uncharacterized protein LOC110733383 [Chenopodium quinoa]XP_021769114.1 uncharacterized protein LOC110733383 [Chenopodium quinoa]
MPNNHNSAIFQAPCPKHAFIYNKTLCSCSPGYLYNVSTKSCPFFNISPLEWWTSSSVKHTKVDDGYQNAIKYEVYYLWCSVVVLLMWVLLCAIVRFGKLKDGRNAWFQIRWWISRLDFTFSTKHWLADQKVVKKRKSELGGTFTIASWILFIGLLAGLLYQIITTLGLEVYTMKAANAPDLVSFINDLELNITTISSMTCSQFRGPSTIVLGTPGSIGYSIIPFSNFANYSSQNSSIGPVVTLRCRNCPLAYENVYVSWQFFDIKNKFPATAVGFQFNFSAKSHVDEHKYANFVSGRIKNGMKSDNTSITYRGANTHVLKFNLFPRVHLNVNGLKLLQPSFHEFRPGSSARDKDKLRSLLHSPKNGLINTTLALRFLTEYMIEIDDGKRYTGLVSFLADVGGLYCLSITLFLLLLTLFESRIKRIRNEDQVMQNIKKRRIAEDHWHKLRRFVAYTFGSRLLDERYNMKEEPTCCIGGNGLSISKFRQREINIQSFGLIRQPQPS